ncbi:MAG TPA: HNH endonuclease signature motif containing protein [Nocardioides sp.]
MAELAAVLGLTTEAGRRLVGHALELRHRLPRLWGRVQAVELPAWRARRVAEATLALAPEAAAFVDGHVAPVAHQVGPAQVDRLVEEAIARFMPETADAARAAAADRRHFTIEHGRVSFDGTSLVHGELDLADALDLEAAISHGAAALATLGSTDTLDVRRSLAAGDLARGQFALDLGADETAAESHTELTPESTGPTSRPTSRPTGRAVPPKRRVVLFVHLSDAAVYDEGVEAEIARVENTGSLVTADTIRDWCGRPDTQIVVKPVIDLDERLATGAYEVNERLAQRVALRDHTCVFPFCQRPARRCDVDHVVPHPRGPTATDNLAPLCRRHHRLKTHGGWAYTVLEPGSYLWRSPHRHQFLRDHTGTLDVTPDSAPGPTHRGLAPDHSTPAPPPPRRPTGRRGSGAGSARVHPGVRPGGRDGMRFELLQSGSRREGVSGRPNCMPTVHLARTSACGGPDVRSDGQFDRRGAVRRGRR